MAFNKKTSGLKLYNLLLKEVSAANRLLPEDRKLSLSERRQLISQKLYPTYKGTPAYKVKKKELREIISKKIKRSKKKAGCDVLAIDPEIYNEGVQYFDIESFLSRTLPNCIYVKVNAGNQFGKTNVFNTRDFDYYKTGVSAITNNINQWIRQQPVKHRNTDKVPMYFGEIQLRPGHKNDGKSDSYYLEMILEVRGKQAVEVEPLDIPKRKKTKKQQQIIKKTNEKIKDRIKEMQPEKSKIKRIAQRIEKTIYETELIRKKRLLDKKTRDKFVSDTFKSEKAKLDKFFKQNIITQSQYERLIKRITKAYKGK